MSNIFSDIGGAEKELARRSFGKYAAHMRPQHKQYWHQILLCKRLHDFATGKIKRLMVFMPPQHTKSSYSSILMPTYIHGLNPNAKIVISSYSASKAEEYNSECQKVIDSEEYAALFPKTKLMPIGVNGKWKRNTEKFEIVDYIGFLKSVGVGGSLTGTSADFAIIDDPVKDREEASSAVISQKTWDWYNSVLFTRIHNNSGIMVIQTRWDTLDLSGRLLEAMADGSGETWTILNLPAIKENDDNPEDPRNIGDALWPEMHSLEKLKQIQKLDKRTFASLYQQNPSPVQVGGEAYKMFDAAASVGQYDYNPDLPLHVSFDFNVNPYMPCGIFQIEKRQIGDNFEYNTYMLAELCLKSPQNTTKSICARIRANYPHHKAGMYIYGDPNGMQADTRSEQGHNDYLVIRTELACYRPQLRILKKSHSVKMRIDFMNTLFSGGYDGITFGVDYKCLKAIEDFQYIKEDSDGSKLKQEATDPSTGVRSQRWGHMSDLTEYFLTVAFPTKFARHMQGGAASMITLGKRKTRHNY